MSAGTSAVAVRRGYQYVVLRCVPRADREEFVNVGVVLYCEDEGFLGCAGHVDEARVAAFAPTLEVEAVRAALAAADDAETGAAARR